MSNNIINNKKSLEERNFLYFVKLVLIKSFKYLFLFLPLVLLIYVLLVKYGAFPYFNSNEPFELIPDMDHQLKILPQQVSKFFPDSLTIRNPVQGTIPENATPYKFGMVEFAKAEEYYKNPLKPTDYVLRRGKNRFETFCSPCHGIDGRASGKILDTSLYTTKTEPFPHPPDYQRKATKDLSDARIFHIISTGQNAMFPPAEKLSRMDRWCIVWWVRHLQGLDTIINQNNVLQNNH